jgi:hypothetical protein
MSIMPSLFLKKMQVLICSNPNKIQLEMEDVSYEDFTIQVVLWRQGLCILFDHHNDLVLTL